MAGADATWQALSAGATNATSTLATVMTTTAVGVGVWHFKYVVRYKAGATTTGVKFAVNHTGTLVFFTAQTRWGTTGTSATSGAATQNQTTPTIYEQSGQRTKGTAMGPTASVDAANADMMAIVEGIMEVSASGDLQLRHASEVTAASSVTEGTILILTKIE